MKFAPACRRAFWIATLFTALGLLPASLFLWGKKAALQKPFFGQFIFPPKKAYDFSLTDQNGKPFHLRDLRGKVVVFAFGFTHCPNICPTTLAALSSFYNELPAKDREQVRVLFISLDPTRDTPEKLKNYVPFFKVPIGNPPALPERLSKFDF
jgi:protein SCO1/2